MAENDRTRVAVLGTLAEFHNEAIPFEISSLLELVANINPDLLCLDITLNQWRERDFDNLPPQYREALLPLASQTDIVVAPIGAEKPPTREVSGAWRRKAITWLRSWIASIQRKAPSPDATNQGWRHDLSNYLYKTIRALSAGPRKREVADYVDHLVYKVLEVSRRDPGTRVLVVINVQYCHIVRQRLREYRDVKVANYRDL